MSERAGPRRAGRAEPGPPPARPASERGVGLGRAQEEEVVSAVVGASEEVRHGNAFLHNPDARRWAGRRGAESLPAGQPHRIGRAASGPRRGEQRVGRGVTFIPEGRPESPFSRGWTTERLSGPDFDVFVKLRALRRNCPRRRTSRPTTCLITTTEEMVLRRRRRSAGLRLSRPARHPCCCPAAPAAVCPGAARLEEAYLRGEIDALSYRRVIRRPGRDRQPASAWREQLRRGPPDAAATVIPPPALCRWTGFEDYAPD